MPEKHGNGKETDITAVLVVAFVLMVGVLIAKTAGDFTKQKTSTDSKAAAPKAKSFKTQAAKAGIQNPICLPSYPDKTDLEGCKQYSASGLIDSYYNPSIKNVVAGSMNGSCGDANSSYDVSAYSCTGALSSDYPLACAGIAPYRKCVKQLHNLQCCVGALEYTKMGTAYCNSFKEITDASGKLISPKPDAKCQDACNTDYNKTLYFNSAKAGSPLNIQVPAPCKYARTEGTKGFGSIGICCAKY